MKTESAEIDDERRQVFPFTKDVQSCYTVRVRPNWDCSYSLCTILPGACSDIGHGFSREIKKFVVEVGVAAPALNADEACVGHAPALGNPDLCESAPPWSRGEPRHALWGLGEAAVQDRRSIDSLN